MNEEQRIDHAISGALRKHGQMVTHLDLARRTHAQIQWHAAAGDKQAATRLRSHYHQWLAVHHYHEVWEPVDSRYQLVGLACTAGKSWGGA